MGPRARRRAEGKREGGALAHHRLADVVAPLAALPSFVSRPMFGCVGCYVRGRLVLVLADRAEPWAGLLIPTERRLHASLSERIRPLRVHPVLGKWLYLPHADDAFGGAASEIVGCILAGDERFGVEPPAPRLPRMGEGGGQARARSARPSARRPGPKGGSR